MNNYPSGYSEPPTLDEYFESQDAAIKNYVQKLEQQLSAITAERDALKARIEEAEKQEPSGWQNEHGVIRESEPTNDDVDYVFSWHPLYAAPIPSPDTAELVNAFRSVWQVIPQKTFFSDAAIARANEILSKYEK